MEVFALLDSKFHAQYSVLIQLRCINISKQVWIMTRKWPDSKWLESCCFSRWFIAAGPARQRRRRWLSMSRHTALREWEGNSHLSKRALQVGPGFLCNHTRPRLTCKTEPSSYIKHPSSTLKYIRLEPWIYSNYSRLILLGKKLISLIVIAEWGILN